MKSYNVKSNAKRAARQLCAKFSFLTPAEPVAVLGHPNEWFPAVTVTQGHIFPIEAAQIAELVPKTAETAPPSVIKRSPREIVAEAAKLPPPAKSSEIEIRERLEARRARMAEEKANPKPTTVNKTDIVINLISREGGATSVEIEAATGWFPHSVRGFIAEKLRKRRGMPIKSVKIKGQPTTYKLDDSPNQ